MCKQTLVIAGRFPSLNDYIKAERTNKFMAHKIKREETERVWWLAKKLRPVSTKVSVAFRWYEPNRRRDIDNIRFATKFILDGIVKAGILPDDSQKWVASIQDTVEVDKENPRVEVDIECI